MKTKSDLKEIVLKMTKREGGSYRFPLEKKKYRRKTDLINLIQTCQGKSITSNDKFEYLTEEELYGYKLKELKEHINTMVSRDKETYKFALTQFNKEKLIDLIITCQGEEPEQKGGCNRNKIKGHGWGFSF